MSFRPSPPDRPKRTDRMSPGLALKRLCADCNQPRSSEGGKTDKRTRQWTCSVCLAARPAPAVHNPATPQHEVITDPAKIADAFERDEFRPSGCP